MDFVDFLRAARRRWIVVALTVAVAIGIGFLSTTVVASGPPVTTYQAGSVILNTGPAQYSGLPGVYNIRTIAALATVGEVPKRVAQRIGYQGDPVILAEEITSSGNQETGLLRIAATSTDPARAKRLADAFAEELVTFLNERNSITNSREAQVIQNDINQLNREIRGLDKRVASASGSSVEILSAE